METPGKPLTLDPIPNSTTSWLPTRLCPAPESSGAYYGSPRGVMQVEPQG